MRSEEGNSFVKRKHFCCHIASLSPSLRQKTTQRPGILFFHLLEAEKESLSFFVSVSQSICVYMSTYHLTFVLFNLAVCEG